MKKITSPKCHVCFSPLSMSFLFSFCISAAAKSAGAFYLINSNSSALTEPPLAIFSAIIYTIITLFFCVILNLKIFLLEKLH